MLRAACDVVPGDVILRVSPTGAAREYLVADVRLCLRTAHARYAFEVSSGDTIGWFEECDLIDIKED